MQSKRYLSLFLCLLFGVMAYAQLIDVPEEPLLFKVYDGTAGGHKFNHDQDGFYPGKRLPVGAESPEGVNLVPLNNVDVYVVSRAFADTLITWQRTNRIDPLAQKDDSVMMSQFYDFYDEYGYKLTRRQDGSYDLQQGFQKAKQIYMRYREIWAFWGDGPTDFELIIHHRGSAPAGSTVQNGAERHRIRDIIRYYTDGSDPERMCPLFYDGKVTGVETQYEVSVKPQFVKRVISLGNSLQFDEHIAAVGRTDQRFIIDRYIESCSFDEDFDHLMLRKKKLLFGSDLNRYSLLLRRVLRSVLASQYIREELPAFVLPGEQFELAMKRRTAFNLEHDTLYQFRLQTERNLGYNLDTVPKRLYLQEDTLTIDHKLSYEMPDVNRYYHMKHITFIQDFAHVEGIEQEECPCYRTNDMRFLSLSSQYAQVDCPPQLPGSFEYENYQPISPSKEFHAIEKEARLVFDKNRSNIDPKMDTNGQELDSLLAIAREIMSDEEAHNRIDTVRVVAISSPEGMSWNYNMSLSKRRAEAVNQWIKVNCEGTFKARGVAKDSVATWLDVADLIESFGLSYKAEADSIRAIVGNDDLHNTAEQQRRLGYVSGSSPAIDRALQMLRKVQISFVYKAQREPSQESVITTFRHGANREHFSAFYYWVLLTSNEISHSDKVMLAKEVIAKSRIKGDEYLQTRYPEYDRVEPEQWFDLIRPLAANILAIESIRQREYDLNILSPYLSPEAVINTTVYDNDENRPFKYINPDFAVYNQLAMLMGKGDEESLSSADIYLQMFQNARISDEFRAKYHPEDLIDLVMCYTTPSLVNDKVLSDRIKRTSIVNFFVMQQSQIHQAYLYEDGKLYTSETKEMIRQCVDSLPSLRAVDEFQREKCYFTAVTEGRYADYIAADEERAGASMEEAQEIKDKHIDAAVQALVELFLVDADMVSFCQGDSYIRDIYRNPSLRSQGIDYYLEAIDEYVRILGEREAAAEAAKAAEDAAEE